MPHLLIVSITILPALETVLSFIEKARSPITPLSFAVGKSKTGTVCVLMPNSFQVWAKI